MLKFKKKFLGRGNLSGSVGKGKHLIFYFWPRWVLHHWVWRPCGVNLVLAFKSYLSSLFHQVSSPWTWELSSYPAWERVSLHGFFPQAQTSVDNESCGHHLCVQGGDIAIPSGFYLDSTSGSTWKKLKPVITSKCWWTNTIQTFKTILCISDKQGMFSNQIYPA